MKQKEAGSVESFACAMAEQEPNWYPGSRQPDVLPDDNAVCYTKKASETNFKDFETSSDCI